MLFVLLISGKVGTSSLLIVCGVMAGYICSAITDFIVTFAEDTDIVNLHNWSMGSFCRDQLGKCGGHDGGGSRRLPWQFFSAPNR